MSDFWHNQRVLVTGERGFLGSHVYRLLDYLNLEDEMGSTHVFGGQTELRNQYAVQRLFKQYGGLNGFTLVIHCAANVGGIGKNRQMPGTLFYDNLLMNTHVLHEAYAAGVQKFIGIGSVCAYPKDTPTPFREHNLWNGSPEDTNAAYGETKRALLMMSQAYRQQYGFNAIHLLMVNLYGPGDHFDKEHSHVIPAMIYKMAEAKAQGVSTITLWGSGEATREFLYVEDAAQAIVRAAEVYNSPEPINIGTGQSIRIRDLAYLIREMVGYTGGIVWDTTMPDGQPKRELDVRRAALEMQWGAETRLEDGLQKTVAWYMRRERINA